PTPTRTLSATPTPTRTGTPEATPTATPTPTPTPTVTVSPSRTAIVEPVLYSSLEPIVFTATESTFIEVPEDVIAVEVIAYGAGGQGGYLSNKTKSNAGDGGTTTGVFPVNYGEVLEVRVGTNTTLGGGIGFSTTTGNG